MKEELNEYRAYLNKHLLLVSIIQRKMDGIILEEITLEEKQTLRAIYDMHLDEVKSAIEED